MLECVPWQRLIRARSLVALVIWFALGALASSSSLHTRAHAAVIDGATYNVFVWPTVSAGAGESTTIRNSNIDTLLLSFAAPGLIFTQGLHQEYPFVLTVEGTVVVKRIEVTSRVMFNALLDFRGSRIGQVLVQRAELAMTNVFWSFSGCRFASEYLLPGTTGMDATAFHFGLPLAWYNSTYGSSSAASVPAVRQSTGFRVVDSVFDVTVPRAVAFFHHVRYQAQFLGVDFERNVVRTHSAQRRCVTVHVVGPQPNNSSWTAKRFSISDNDFTGAGVMLPFEPTGEPYLKGERMNDAGGSAVISVMMHAARNVGTLRVDNNNVVFSPRTPQTTVAVPVVGISVTGFVGSSDTLVVENVSVISVSGNDIRNDPVTFGMNIFVAVHVGAFREFRSPRPWSRVGLINISSNNAAVSSGAELINSNNQVEDCTLRGIDLLVWNCNTDFGAVVVSRNNITLSGDSTLASKRDARNYGIWVYFYRLSPVRLVDTSHNTIVGTGHPGVICGIYFETPGVTTYGFLCARGASFAGGYALVDVELLRIAHNVVHVSGAVAVQGISLDWTPDDNFAGSWRGLHAVSNFVKVRQSYDAKDVSLYTKPPDERPRDMRCLGVVVKAHAFDSGVANVSFNTVDLSVAGGISIGVSFASGPSGSWRVDRVIADNNNVNVVGAAIQLYFQVMGVLVGAEGSTYSYGHVSASFNNVTVASTGSCGVMTCAGVALMFGGNVRSAAVIAIRGNDIFVRAVLDAVLGIMVALVSPPQIETGGARGADAVSKLFKDVPRIIPSRLPLGAPIMWSGACNLSVVGNRVDVATNGVLGAGFGFLVNGYVLGEKNDTTAVDRPARSPESAPIDDFDFADGFRLLLENNTIKAHFGVWSAMNGGLLFAGALGSGVLEVPPSKKFAQAPDRLDLVLYSDVVKAHFESVVIRRNTFQLSGGIHSGVLFVGDFSASNLTIDGCVFNVDVSIRTLSANPLPKQLPEPVMQQLNLSSTVAYQDVDGGRMEGGILFAAAIECRVAAIADARLIINGTLEIRDTRATLKSTVGEVTAIQWGRGSYAGRIIMLNSSVAITTSAAYVRGPSALLATARAAGMGGFVGSFNVTSSTVAVASSAAPTPTPAAEAAASSGRRTDEAAIVVGAFARDASMCRLLQAQAARESNDGGATRVARMSLAVVSSTISLDVVPATTALGAAATGGMSADVTALGLFRMHYSPDLNVTVTGTQIRVLLRCPPSAAALLRWPVVTLDKTAAAAMASLPLVCPALPGAITFNANGVAPTPTVDLSGSNVSVAIAGDTSRFQRAVLGAIETSAGQLTPNLVAAAVLVLRCTRVNGVDAVPPLPFVPAAYDRRSSIIKRCAHPPTRSRTQSLSRVPLCSRFALAYVAPSDSSRLTTRAVRGREFAVTVALVVPSEFDTYPPMPQRVVPGEAVLLEGEPQSESATTFVLNREVLADDNATTTARPTVPTAALPRVSSNNLDVAFVKAAVVGGPRALLLTLVAGHALSESGTYDVRIDVSPDLFACLFPTPTSTPTPRSEWPHVTIRIVPSVEPPPAAIAALNSLGDGAALLMAATGNPSGMARMNSMRAVLNSFDCGMSFSDELASTEHPLRFGVGHEDGQYLRGAVVGNTLLIVLLSAIVSGIALLQYHRKQRLKLKRLQRRGSLTAPPVVHRFDWHAYIVELFQCTLPCFVLVPAFGLMQGTLSASVALMYYRRQRGDVAFGLLGAAPAAAMLVLSAYELCVRLARRPFISYVRFARVDWLGAGTGNGVVGVSAAAAITSETVKARRTAELLREFFPECDRCCGAGKLARGPRGECGSNSTRDPIARLRPESFLAYRILRWIISEYGDWAVVEKRATRSQLNESRLEFRRNYGVLEPHHRHPQQAQSAADRRRRVQQPTLARRAVDVDDDAARRSQPTVSWRRHYAAYIRGLDAIIDDYNDRGRFQFLIEAVVMYATAVTTALADPEACVLSSLLMTVINIVPFTMMVATTPFRRRAAALYGIGSGGIMCLAGLSVTMSHAFPAGVFDFIGRAIGSVLGILNSLKLGADLADIFFFVEPDMYMLPLRLLRHVFFHRRGQAPDAAAGTGELADADADDDDVIPANMVGAASGAAWDRGRDQSPPMLTLPLRSRRGLAASWDVTREGDVAARPRR